MQENASHTPETVERFLDSTLESVDSAEELAVGMAQRAGMDEDDLMKIGMAIRESDGECGGPRQPVQRP